MWKLVVAVKDQGADGQILTSKGAGFAPEWKSRTEMNIPTVAVVADKKFPTNVMSANTVLPLAYVTKYLSDFTYNETDATFRPQKSGYYQISVYNKMDVSIPNINTGDNRGIAITKLCLKQGSTYTDLLSFSGYYALATTYIFHPLSGLIYLTAGQDYVVRTTFEKKFQIVDGGISLTYLGE